MTVKEAREKGYLDLASWYRRRAKGSAGRYRLLDADGASQRELGSPRKRGNSKAHNTGKGTPQRILYEALRESAPEGTRIEWERKGLIDGRRYEVDIYLPDARLCVEVDGFQFHRSLQAFKKDRERQNAFVLAGYRVLRYTTKEVYTLASRRRIVEEILSAFGSANRSATGGS